MKAGAVILLLAAAVALVSVRHVMITKASMAPNALPTLLQAMPKKGDIRKTCVWKRWPFEKNTKKVCVSWTNIGMEFLETASLFSSIA